MRRLLLIGMIILTISAMTVGEEPQPTPGERTHVVTDGESLYSIAARYGVTVVSIAELNGITDFNVVRVGQVLRIPAGTSPLAPPAGSGANVPSAATAFPVNQASAVGFAYGMQIYLPGQDTATVINHLRDLGVTWVAHEIAWENFEATPGQIDFVAMDAIVNPLNEAGFNILLTLTAAPAWARTEVIDDGPPNDYGDFARFVGQVAAHYAGIVDAYEIWSEPNLRANWTGKSISGSEYTQLLRVAFNAIKQGDPAARVISAGLAPTQTNDGTNAVDDRVFLQQMYDAGAASFSDAIGVHPEGWANSADSVCCENNRPAVAAWDTQKAFFFLETIRDYRAILNQNGDDGKFLWVTSFGWGSSEGITSNLNPDFGFVSYTDQLEQAQYLTRGFQLGRDLSYVGPMFVNNLNFCQAFGTGGVECYWSVLTSDGNPRPVYEAIRGTTP